jgi:hypothetical protein
MRKNQRAFVLADYIDKYIQESGYTDKKVAQHLKEIIPKTTHLDENTFNEIIEELKREMDRGKDFKSAFNAVRIVNFLNGDFIKADLPDILTRIILNKTTFISNIKKGLRQPYTVEKIEAIFTSRNKKLIITLLGKLRLAKKKVAFATFDEGREDGNPFLNDRLEDVINQLGLDVNAFAEGEPLTAVKIRYKNGEEMGKRYPTFLDAGWYDKFYPADKKDNYGRTKSLDPTLKNMPEVVHENLELSDIMEDIELLED